MQRINFNHHTSKVFYVGIVEDRLDPLYMGRCRVRVFGLHDEDRVMLPIEDLPWALPLMPINSASITGVGWSPTGIVTGSRVLVTFVDDDFQIPIMMGTLPGFNEENPFGEFENSTTVNDKIIYDKASDMNKSTVAPPAPGDESVVKSADGSQTTGEQGGSVIAPGVSVSSDGTLSAPIPASVANAVQTLPSSISSALSSLPASVSSAAQSMVSGLQTTFGPALGGVQGAVQMALGAVSAASTALSAVNSAQNALKNANSVNGALAAAVNVKNLAGSTMSTVGGLLGTTNTTSNSGTMDPYSAAFKPNGVSAAVSGAVGSGSLLGSANGLVNSASGLLGNVSSAQNIIANAKGIGGISAAVINGGNLLSSSLANVGGMIGAGINIGTVVTNQISSLKEQFGGDLSGFGDSISSMFGNISTLVDPEIIADKLGSVAEYAGSVFDKGVDAAAMLISAGQMEISQIENDMQRNIVSLELQKNMCEMSPEELVLMQQAGVDLNKVNNDLGALSNKGSSALTTLDLNATPFTAITQKMTGATGSLSDLMRTATFVTGSSKVTGQIQSAISTASSVAGTLQRTVSKL